MKKKSKSAAPKVDPYIDGLMAKLLERLVSLERKMDSVVSHVSRLASSNGNTPKNIQVPQAPPPPARHERMMYEAVCADCSKVCEVPFKPSEDRAVYCKNCWASRKGLPAGRQVAASNRPGMPVLRPVALPPKPVGKLHLPIPAPSKKSAPAKKAKKKKK